MKKIRQLAQKRVTILTLLVIFGFSNANNFSSYSESRPIKVKKLLDSEIIFRDLFFCDQGSESSIFEGLPFYEEYLGQIKNFSKDKQIERKKFVNQIIENIKKNDKEYFENFNKVLISKNPYLIKKELSNSYKVISNAISVSPYKNIYKDAEKIYQEKYSKTPINNEQDFKKLSKNLTKDIELQNLNEKELCVDTAVAAVVAAYVAAVAVESIGYFNMALRTTVFLWTKGKVFKEVEELAYSESNLLSDEIVARILEYEG